MKIYHDDDGLIDPMDRDKDRRIEQLKQQQQKVERNKWVEEQNNFYKSMINIVEAPAFAPHCPGCYSRNLRLPNFGNVVSSWWCKDCGLQFYSPDLLQLRPLPPCPAPPYTQDEVNQLCAPSC